MSLAPSSLRKMHIIAVPLTRPKLTIQGATEPKRVLTYYQFQLTAPKPPPPPKEGASEGKKSRWLPEEGIANYLSTKAATTWAGFGKAEEGNWKLRVYQTGERLVDRMDFEELALKGIDPSLGPSLVHPLPEVEGDSEKGPRIPLIYPSSLSSDSESLLQLRKLLEHRMPRHRRGFYLWMAIAPFMAPFMIIPVIPNLPFFFCAWRSWSHYRAYRATQYLQDLLANDAIVPEASQALDAIFKDFTPPESSAADEKNPSNETPASKDTHEPLLTRDAVPAIVNLFGLKDSAAAELYRAIEQARLRIKAGQLNP